MKFSILIANYNNGKYIRQCFDSILAQTWKDWEVIIVDDGSTDDSVEVIENLIKDDSRFKLFASERNLGCGSAKRRCAELATGTICGYLDPDDALTPDALDQSIIAYRGNKIIATYSKITFCDAELNPVSDYKKIKKIHNSRFFFNLPIQIHHFFTFRKEIYDKTVGINPDLKSAVDQDLYLKILEHGKVVFIPKNLYLYRRHSEGISQEKSKNKAKENFAKVIFDTLKRRNIKKIKGKSVPSHFTTPEEIFGLLDYQNSLLYRLRLKFLTLFS